MSELKGAFLIGQSGGPSSVINASCLGAIEGAMAHSFITGVYAAQHGIRGILDDVLFDLRKEDPKELSLLRYTPAAAFGSVRYKLKDSEEDPTDYERILEVFKKHDIRYFLYNGGNDSMDTCNKISKYMTKVGYECRIMGIPKTIDNDLDLTDHCPGYPSAAKYIATSVAEIIKDAKVYDKGAIVILEIMGRNAGWLTAAASAAKVSGEGPSLIYLPETDFDMDRFVSDVCTVWEKQKYAVVAVSEGIHDKDGKLISQYESRLNDSVDVFGHTQLGGLAAILASYCKSHSGIKTRPIEYSLLQRCAAHIASKTDIEEAYMAGKAAIDAAAAGITDKMVAFQCNRENGYRCETKLVDLTAVANAEKRIPTTWINKEKNNISDEFLEYVLPLIDGEASIPYENGLPRYAKLKYIKAD